jgi:hypothetical protein
LGKRNEEGVDEIMDIKKEKSMMKRLKTGTT